MTNEKNTSFLISCASLNDESNLTTDSSGFRADHQMFMHEQLCKSFTECSVVLGAVAAAVPMAAGTDNKAADHAVSLLLDSLAEEFFEHPYEAAYTLNKDMCHKDMQAVLAAIGIRDHTARLLFSGNMSVLRFHDASLERITPVKQSSFPEIFFGMSDEDLKIPAQIKEYPVCSGDIWILCTDVVTDPFTYEDSTLDTELIIQIISAECESIAETLIRFSSETYWPYYTKNLVYGCRSALVLKII